MNSLLAMLYSISTYNYTNDYNDTIMILLMHKGFNIVKGTINYKQLKQIVSKFNKNLTVTMKITAAVLTVVIQ